MPDYQLGKIYKLTSHSNNLVYYGSTAQQHLSTRIASHIRDYNCYLNNKGDYTYSFKVLECDDYKYEVIENYPCNNIKQLKDRERWYIQNNECVNKCIPNRTAAEYYQDNIEYFKEQQKEYREANKDKIKDKNKKYNEANKDKIKEYNSEKIICQCGCEIRRSDLAAHKKTQKHLDLVQNIVKIKTNKSDVIVCECGCQIIRSDIARHKKTKKHIRLMAAD